MIDNIELRTAPVREVDYPARRIELIAVPYDEWTFVEYEGRMIEESFAPGAFKQVERRVGESRFQVNIDHDPARWVGRVIGLTPGDPAGLRAELQIRRGPDFEQVLMDAADGMLAGSVGFGVLPQNQKWEGRDRRRVTTAYLDHIALTPTPAYASANVIAVRTATSSATPNLDAMLAERTARQYVIDV